MADKMDLDDDSQRQGLVDIAKSLPLPDSDEEEEIEASNTMAKTFKRKTGEDPDVRTKRAREYLFKTGLSSWIDGIELDQLHGNRTALKDWFQYWGEGEDDFYNWPEELNRDHCRILMDAIVGGSGYEHILTCFLNRFVAFDKRSTRYLRKTLVEGEITFTQHTESEIRKIFKNCMLPEAFAESLQLSKSSTIFDLWNTHPNRREFSYQQFEVSKQRKTGVFNTFDKGEFLLRKKNLKQLYTEKKAEIDYETSLFFEHILEIWCHGDESLNQYVIKLLAFFFQKPDTLPEVAFLIHGLQGTGKSMPILLFLKLFGKYGRTLDKSGAFEKNFNAVLSQMICGYLDEVEIDTPHQLMTMKNMITGETKGIRAMRQDRVIEQNYTRLFLASNHEHKQNLMTADNRRFFALETARTMLDDKHGKKSIRDYGKRFCINLEYLAAKVWQIDLNGFEPTNFPDTPLMKKWQQKSLDITARFWMDCIVHGQIGHDEFWREFDTGHTELNRMNRFGEPVNKKGIYDAFTFWTKFSNSRPVANNVFWKKTKEYFENGGCYFASNPVRGGIPIPLVQIGGTIDEIKGAFEQSIGFVGIFMQRNPPVFDTGSKIVVDIEKVPLNNNIDPNALLESARQLNALNLVTDGGKSFYQINPDNITLLQPIKDALNAEGFKSFEVIYVEPNQSAPLCVKPGSSISILGFREIICIPLFGIPIYQELKISPGPGGIRVGRIGIERFSFHVGIGTGSAFAFVFNQD